MRITHLWRYPVKSLSGEALTQTRIERCGIPFDRVYRLVDERDGVAGKALTARQIPGMLAFRASAASNSVSVEAPDGSVAPAGEQLAGLLRSVFNRALRIETVQAGGDPFFDDSHLLVINASSVRALSREMGSPVDLRRFRPSIVLDADDAQPFVEDCWTGKVFRAGTAELDIVKRNIRCVMTNIDPKTCAVNPSFLKFLIQNHEQCFGVYASVRRPGTVAVGDEWRPL